MDKHLANFLGRDAIVESTSYMHTEFVTSIKSCEHCEVQETAGLPLQPRPRPHVTPAMFCHKLLQGRGKVVRVCQGTFYSRLSKDSRSEL
jgi:hypothetical protein